MMRVSKRTASGTSVRRVLSRSAKRFVAPFDRLEDRTVLSNVMTPVGTIADEILVQYRPEANVQTRAANRANAGFGLLEEIDSAQRLDMGQGMIELVKVPAGMTSDEAVSWLSIQPGVEFAEPNQILTLSAVSNDTYYTSGSLWGMYGSDSPTTIGPAGTTNANGIHAENAWNAGYTGSRSVYVGIIDTGVQIDHPELAANVWVNPYDPVDGIDNDGNGYVDDTNGWDFAANDSTVYDSTSDSHGTHVAGTIGGSGGNGLGVAGVNWEVSLIVAKFISGNSGTTSNAIRAIDYITDLKLRHGLNIAATNNSWGGGSYSSAMNAAIIRAAKADILFVAAAGNSSANIDSTAFYPAAYSTLVSVGSTTAASYEGVISVASITSTGGLSSFSNYGATRVDIGAPGSNIMSTLPVNSYGSYNGTSMATPHVTGSIALLKSIYTSATAEQLRNAILSSATPTASLAGKVASGGRLNVFSAINSPTWNSNPQVPGISVSNVSKNEGNSGTTNFVFTISLSSVSAQPVTFAYATQNGTALSGADYTAVSGSLTIPAGSTSGSIAVTVVGDTVYEANETFRLLLSSPVNATITDGEAVATILNDDSIPALSISDTRLLEGNSGSSNMVFKVSMTNPADTPVTFQYATSDITATAGIDYVSASGMITIAAGATSATIAVPILGDTDYEADETVRVTLSNPSSNATIAAPFATGTIVNDDTPPVPSMSIVSTSKSEGNSGSASMFFNVSLSGASASPITVNYATSSGTASSGSDFAATSGTLTIPAGATSGTIAVTIFGDNVYEADETLVVTLSSPVNATIATATAIGTILNDDAKPAISIANASRSEGNSGSSDLIFTVTMSNPADAPVSVQYATSNDSAIAGSDYLATAGTLTIPAGATSATIAVPILGDTVVEADETLLVTLTNPS
ncbi:S8 family serine peptidase, partial [bacterium]|nr:S8 family serine peptidase [bacterium]